MRRGQFIWKGIGRRVAYQCFDRFRGVWEVMVMSKNRGAYKFWHSVIGAYTGNHFQEYTKCIAHLENSEKNILMFESRYET